jgi:hypothetical protein
MSPLPLGRRLLPLAAVAATLAVAAAPSVAGASTPAPAPVCTLTKMPQNPAAGITLCHEGFEIAFVHTAGGWDPYVVQAAGKSKSIKAVVVLIGANDYG